MADGDKKVCKTQALLGKNLPEEICHTKDEWAAIRKGQSEGVRDTQRSIQATSGNTMTSPAGP